MSLSTLHPWTGLREMQLACQMKPNSETEPRGETNDASDDVTQQALFSNILTAIPCLRKSPALCYLTNIYLNVKV